MRVMVIHAHPDTESYNAALYRTVLDALAKAGHEVDPCDLHEDDFQPVLTRSERRGYHDIPNNRAPVEAYVGRIERAEAIVLVFPVWNFGFPAILKGFFDRVFLPGVSFRIVDGLVRPNLQHIAKLMVVTTYGGPRWRALIVGDPPRKIATRVLRTLIKPTGSMTYLAHYDMNRSTPQSRAAFLGRVAAFAERF